MPTLTELIRGFPGKPSHPPLTDVSIGAYTAGVVLLVIGSFGFQEEPMAHGALLAIAVGLVAAVPTAVTGLLDWVALPKATPARRLATVHLLVMVTATVLFAVTVLVHLEGYRNGVVSTAATVWGVVAEAVLAVGGYLGGALAYVYGVRVLKRPDAPPADALIPGRQEPEPPP